MESSDPTTPKNLETSDNTSGTLCTPPQTLLCLPVNEKKGKLFKKKLLKRIALLMPLNLEGRASF